MSGARGQPPKRNSLTLCLQADIEEERFARKLNACRPSPIRVGDDDGTDGGDHARDVS